MASIFNTVEVTTGRTARIINFVETSDDFYVAIGRSAEWDGSFGLNVSDTNPPSPDPNSTAIPDPIIYKKVEVAAPASRSIICEDFNTNTDTLSSIILVQQSLNEESFSILDPSEIVNPDGSFNQNPEFVYVSARILGTDYDVDEWRASALYTRLYLADGVTAGLDTYTPAQVTGGLLHHLTYNTPVERDDSKIHKFEYLINL